MSRLIKFFLLLFLLFFLFNALRNMSTIPLHDFDEANRAEGAKNMKRYHFFLAPLTGSPFHRVENLKIKAKNNPQLYIYYHLERPPLFYWLMIFSTSIFGENEFAYRLPSLISGLLLIILFFIFFQPLSALVLIFSFDLWLSSQQALMDTTLTLFLLLAFLFFMKFIQSSNDRVGHTTDAVKLPFLFLSAFFWSLAFLAKGQPALIFFFLLFFALLTKRIKIKELIFFGFFSFLIISPWLFFLVKNFGINTFSQVFFNFAKNRALAFDPTQQAPFFWYFRWLFESARPAWILFLTLFIYDLLQKKMTHPKALTLFYFFSSFLIFSLAKNKVWWYILPLFPVMVFYIDLSLRDLLKENQNKIFNFSLIILLTSLPIFYHQRNLVALVLVVFYLLISLLILKKIKTKKISKTVLNFIYLFSMIFSLTIFLFNFPPIQPNYPEVKRVGEYYRKLPQPKCLYLQNLPYESALFYTDAEEINYLTEKTKLKKDCQNYLLTPNEKNEKLVFKKGRLKVYKLK